MTNKLNTHSKSLSGVYVGAIIMFVFVLALSLSAFNYAYASQNCQTSDSSKVIVDDGTMSSSLWSGQQLNPAHPATIYGYQATGGNPGSFYLIKHAEVYTSDGPGRNTGTVNLYSGATLNPATDIAVRNLASINMSVQTKFVHSVGGQLDVGLYLAQQGGTKNIIGEKTVYGKDTWITSNFTVTRSQLEQMNFDISASGQPIYVGFSTSHSSVFADNIIKVDNFRATLNYFGSSCQNITCNSNSDCASPAYTGSPFCQGNNVYQNYITYTCNNAGTANSYCSSNTVTQLKTTCTGNQTCQNGSCGTNCTSHSYQQCVGNYLYWYNSCGNQEDSQYCQNGCNNNSCGGQNCTSHSYQQCSGNYLYWYDSCGNQQDSQYCQNGCSGNQCQNQNNNCTYHAYKLCLGNSVYWYDSCGNQQGVYQACYGTNQTCQYGQCVYTPPAPNPYIAHYNTACYSDNLYWYDSLGQKNDLYKSCSDSNNCTQDTCASGKCSNTIKCDGTTCASGSVDYNNYCATGNCGNGLCEPNLGETSANCSNDCKQNINTLSVSFFAKQDASSMQWQKTVQVGQNGQVYFMISVANSGSAQIDNTNVSASIPNEISYLGNLQVNGVLVSGDIVSGINIGSLAPATAKTITFEGKTQTLSVQATKQATTTVDVSGATQTDSVGVIFNPGQVAGASISSTETTGFWEFLKRWYLWILVALFLIFLFFVVFRRLSSNNNA